MNSKLATCLFKQADQSYRGRNYAAALEVLDRLDKAYPDSRRILFPRAMCLAEVGRTDEAIAICDRLISRHKYKRARDLKARVQKYQRVLPAWNAGGPKLPPLDIEHMNLDSAPTAFAPAPRPPASEWQSLSVRFLMGAILFVVALAAVAGYIAVSRDAGIASAAQPAPQATPADLAVPAEAPDEAPQEPADEMPRAPGSPTAN